jgi:hypothetical protein
MKEENRSFPAYDILVFLLLFVQQSIACLLESSEINQFPQSVIEYTIRKPIPKKESIGVDHYTKFHFSDLLLIPKSITPRKEASNIFRHTDLLADSGVHV